jgi:hypothetical protein
MVHHLGAHDLRFEDETLGVDQDVTLSALDLLASVVTLFHSAYCGTLERLRINYARAGLRIPSQADPQSFADRAVDPLPGTVDTPSPEVVVDGRPSREVVGEQAPLTSALQNVEDSVEDLTKIVSPQSSMSFGCWHMRLDEVPFGVAEICLLRFSHA